MNKRIRSMIDEIFSEMKMTAENLALRDELMANAQARYEDAIAQGMSEDKAFDEVAASLGDVQALLHEMNGEPAQDGAQEAAQAAPEEAAAQEDEPAREKKKGVKVEFKFDPTPSEKAGKEGGEINLSETLNKAFSALDDFGRSIMPQAKKFVRDMDDATGGALKSVGKAVNKGMKDAQKAAGEAIDRMGGELVFDFGKREEPKKPESDQTPDQLREEAKDLRAQAGFKRVTGDEQSALELQAQADALDAQADELEAALAEEAMRAAQQAAAEEAERASQAAAAPEAPDAPQLEEKHEPLLDAEGDVNEDVFAKVVDQIQKDAQQVIGDAEEFIRDAAGLNDEAGDAEYTVTAEPETTNSRLFPAAGLRSVDIQLDADDVRIEAYEGEMIETIWQANNVDGQPEIALDGHKLVIRRKNPDVFKTFFSVFSKEGGQITVRVPHGYAADYRVSTTSGDVHLYEVDADSLTVTTTSGSVRLEPDASVRADLVKVETVSGSVTVSACAGDVKAETVSGSLFISCDAQKVDVDSVSGKVHVEGACEEWKVDSVSGGVELVCTVAPTRKIDIDTVSATARVALPGEIRGFAAKLNSMSGRLVNEFGPDRYGTCALPIHMDSMSGSLMITRL